MRQCGLRLRTADRQFLRSIGPDVVHAVEWMERYGDLDGDGYVEYNRCVHRGPANQGWYYPVRFATGDGPVTGRHRKSRQTPGAAATRQRQTS